MTTELQLHFWITHCQSHGTSW